VRDSVSRSSETAGATDSILDNHRIAAEELAAQLGLGQDVRDSLRQAFERWDGKGTPGEAKGDDISIASRLVSLADVVEVFHRAGGVPAAISVARERSGTQFDPALVNAFCRDAAELFGGIESATTWDAVIAAEPELEVVLTDEELDAALAAMANFADLKSPYTLGHSCAVAELAGAAARIAELPDGDAVLVRRAGFVHDLGRLGVSNAIWDKRVSDARGARAGAPPSVPHRTHAGLVGGPGPLGAVAVQHHERLDGSGYPRGTSGESLSPAGRILAAAATYRAKLEPRPHRRELAPEEVASYLRAEVKGGRLDGDAVNAVLRAAGHPARRRRAWPAGLTSREVEVLRLAALGLSNREIADRLVISRKTAANHVEHIYAKIGVSNRARASLFAVRNG
jgi:HD-GYP domain-containing protein (c-di-GMP phosphodiesterase class II)